LLGKVCATAANEVRHKLAKSNLPKLRRRVKTDFMRAPWISGVSDGDNTNDDRYKISLYYQLINNQLR
jgi:hypothetical protein